MCSRTVEQKVADTTQDESIIDNQIKELETSVLATAKTMKFLSSETAIKYMENDLVTSESKIKDLEKQKEEAKMNKSTINIEVVMEHIKYFLEHLEELLIDGANPLKRAAFFGLIFDEMPTYQDLLSGTPKLAPYLALKPHFATSLVTDGDPAGNRTPVIWMRTKCPNR